MSTASMGFARFMASAAGRLIRIVAGLGLGWWGWTMRGTTMGMVLMVLGAIAFLAGAVNVCLIAPLIGAPFSGKDALRAPSSEPRP